LEVGGWRLEIEYWGLGGGVLSKILVF